MKRKFLSALVASLALVALGLLSVGSASASTMENKTAASALLAMYGSPEVNLEAVPGGGGLGRNFGAGENMLFQGDTAAKVGKNLGLSVGGVALEAGDTYLGMTLMSNKTPETSPVGALAEFVDFQESKANGALVPTYTDTADRGWVLSICGKAATCKVDARAGGAGAHLVKLEDVTFAVGKPGEMTV